MKKCKTKDCKTKIQDNYIYCSIECYIYDGNKLHSISSKKVDKRSNKGN